MLLLKFLLSPRLNSTTPITTEQLSMNCPPTPPSRLHPLWHPIRMVLLLMFRNYTLVSEIILFGWICRLKSFRKHEKKVLFVVMRFRGKLHWNLMAKDSAQLQKYHESRQCHTFLPPPSVASLLECLRISSSSSSGWFWSRNPRGCFACSVFVASVSVVCSSSGDRPDLISSEAVTGYLPSNRPHLVFGSSAAFS